MIDGFIFSVLWTVKHWNRFLGRLCSLSSFKISLKNSFICTVMELMLLSHYRCAVIYKISEYPMEFCKNTTMQKPATTYFHTQEHNTLLHQKVPEESDRHFKFTFIFNRVKNRNNYINCMVDSSWVILFYFLKS